MSNRVVSFVHVVLLAAVALTIAGCGDVNRDSDGDGRSDRVVCPSDVPPPNNACLADQCGNELGVGRPCTKGGGQCDVYSLFGGEAGICIPDFADNTTVHACSRPCSVDDDCGTDAQCFPDPLTGRLGCVINGCEGL